MGWYTGTVKTSSEFTGMDSTMQPGQISEQSKIKMDMATDTSQGLSGEFTGIGGEGAPDLGFGVRVEKCGEEPGPGGCGRPINDSGKWLEQSVQIGDKRYQSYTCYECKHTVKPYTMEYTRKKGPNHRRKNKKRRLSNRITQRTLIKESASPAAPGYNNPADTPYGRLDLSEDVRVIPWERVIDSFEAEYDHNKQRNNADYKVVKVRDRNGNEKFVRVKKKDTKGNAKSQANTYKQKGRIKKQPRYNPHKGDKQKSPGAWPHNRNPGREGWYGQSDPGPNANADGRSRVLTWDEYMENRNPYSTSIPH